MLVFKSYLKYHDSYRFLEDYFSNFVIAHIQKVSKHVLYNNNSSKFPCTHHLNLGK